MKHRSKRKKATVTISDEIIWEARVGGYTAQLVDDSILQVHKLFVEPDLESVEPVTSFVVETIDWELQSWVSSWWARLLRWIHCRKLFGIRIKLPSPLAWVARSKKPVTVFVCHDLPEDFLERVHAQRFELVLRGENPTMILVGRAMLYKIQAHPELQFGFQCRQYGPAMGNNKSLVIPKLYGLELRYSPWLDNDAIVVV